MLQKLLAVSVMLFLTGTVAAQLLPGPDCYAFPPGAKAGQTVEVRLGGSDWTPDVQFFVQDKRVKLEVMGTPGEVLLPEPPFWFGIKSFNNDPRLPREVSVRLHLPADLPPGPVRWSVANANGAGAGGVFMVGTLPEITEDENRKRPQEIATFPVIVNGRLKRIEEVDRYQFRATTTGLVTCDLVARRLENDFNGVLTIYDGDNLIAEAIDTVGIDPVLTFAIEKGRTYTIAVRDVDHRGYRNLTYRLQLTPGPRIVTAVPPAGKRGEKRQVEFIGLGIATGQPRLEKLSKEVAFPAGGSNFQYKLETPHGTTQPFAFQLSDTDELTEGRNITVPGAITGRISQRGEKGIFTFTGKKGDLLDIGVQAKQIGSPLDASLAIVGPDGKELAANDDFGDSPDPRLQLALPVDGIYQAIVADVSGKSPGLDSVYRLVVRRQSPGFTLRTTRIANIPISGKIPLKVDVIREGGFKGPVTLEFAGLSKDVSLPKESVIPGNAATLSVLLECDKTAGVSASLVLISGTATIDGRIVKVTADTDVLVATTMKPPFKLKSPDADNTRKVERGATHLADLIIERTDGFTGEILLDMAGTQSRHRQGICGPVFPVAPGKVRILYPVTVPEWLESTRTSRIALVAMARIPDPKGTPRWVMMSMDGQVTMSIGGALMKLTHTGDELTVVCGEPVEVPLKLSRSPQIAGQVKVELIVPSDLKDLVSSTPLEWPADKLSGSLRLTTKADPQLVGTWKLLARATGMRDGFPVVSEAEFEIDVIPPPAKKK